MFPLFRKNLFFHHHPSKVRTFLIRFPFSSPPPPPPQPDSRSVRVSVWWDVDNCGVPSGISYWNVAPSIISAVRANGIKGPIDISAYHKFSTNLKEFDKLALLSTGISLHPVESDHAYSSLTKYLQSWIATNPPPVHLFLISGDSCDNDFSGLLHHLTMKNYNILIACPGRGSRVLRSSATIMWQWSSMLKGENLTGKHFNHPPHGPFDSLYGHSKGPFENPFSDTEEPTQNAEILEYPKSGEVVTLENPFSAVEEPTSSKKQGGSGS